MRFVSSGTEATMSAIRAARGFTKRDLILKFEGCYHGHSDSFLSEAGRAWRRWEFPCPGVPDAFASLTLNAPYNDSAAVEKLFRAHAGKIAAVIVEPVAANMGVVPPAAGFLQRLREITQADGGAAGVRRSDFGLSLGVRRGAERIRDPAGPDDARQNYRRGIASGGVRRTARNNGNGFAARACLSGGHSQRQSLGDARGAGGAAQATSFRLLRRAGRESADARAGLARWIEGIGNRGRGECGGFGADAVLYEPGGAGLCRRETVGYGALRGVFSGDAAARNSSAAVAIRGAVYFRGAYRGRRGANPRGSSRKACERFAEEV